jgi:hypothetical protein
MNKKEWVILLSLFFVIVFFVGAKAEIPGAEEGYQNDSIVQGVEGLQETVEGRKWEYIGEQWKELLLKNKNIAAIDAMLKKFNIVFVVLFGRDYELSLILLFTIMFWIFFFAMFSKIITGFSTFSSGVSFIIAFILTIILAQFKAYYALSLLVVKVLFFKQGIWPWIAFLVFFVAYLIFLIYLERIVWKIGRAFKKSKEEKEKWDERFHRQIFETRVRGLEKAFGTVEESFKDGD